MYPVLKIQVSTPNLSMLRILMSTLRLKHKDHLVRQVDHLISNINIVRGDGSILFTGFLIIRPSGSGRFSANGVRKN